MNDLYLLRWLACGWSQRLAADRLGVTTRTVRNWERGAHRAPAHVADYYRMAAGQAPAWAPRWRGWRWSTEGLHGPDGGLYLPNDIMSARWLVRQLQKSGHQARGTRNAASTAPPATQPTHTAGGRRYRATTQDSGLRPARQGQGSNSG